MTKENIPLGQAAYEFGIVLLALIVGFILMSWSFSHTSGWIKLRAIHGVNKADLLQSWWFQSAVFDNGYGIPIIFGSYRSCLKFGYSADGVYLSGVFPFVLFHRPILIPWKDAVVTLADGYLLYSMSVPTVSISIFRTVFNGLVDSKLIQNTNSLLAS
ncbi:MAG: hypothetical protein IPL32_12020 [Chloracidobacterium sp.]|nr:hypothetical protein [Chloracidobacterium sp.]